MAESWSEDQIRQVRDLIALGYSFGMEIGRAHV